MYSSPVNMAYDGWLMSGFSTGLYGTAIAAIWQGESGRICHYDRADRLSREAYLDRIHHCSNWIYLLITEQSRTLLGRQTRYCCNKKTVIATF